MEIYEEPETSTLPNQQHRQSRKTRDSKNKSSVQTADANNVDSANVGIANAIDATPRDSNNTNMPKDMKQVAKDGDDGKERPPAQDDNGDQGNGTLSASASSDDEDFYGTDDRVAAQFRHEFMEAMQARHRQRQAAGQAKQQARQARQAAAAKELGRPVSSSLASSSAAASQQQSSSRGPKLGGSRSARAAMRHQLWQERQEKEADARHVGVGAGISLGKKF